VDIKLIIREGVVAIEYRLGEQEKYKSCFAEFAPKKKKKGVSIKYGGWLGLSA